MMDNWFCTLITNDNLTLGKCLFEVKQNHLGWEIMIKVVLNELQWKLNKEAKIILSFSDLKSYPNLA